MGENLLEKLSPELRNRVYEDVLPEGASIVVGTMKGFDAGNGKKKAWREPALLQASKLTRYEASAMYYRGNSFVARAKLQDFKRLGAWLEHLTKRCGPELFRGLEIQVTCATWTRLPHAASLAKIFHHTGLRVQSTKKLEHARSYAGHSTLFTLAAPRRAIMTRPIDRIVRMGEQAAQKGWSKDELNRCLEEQMKELLNEKPIKKAIEDSQRRVLN